MIDWGILLAIVMLIVWAIGTLLSWSGWVHALLTAGLCVLAWRIVRRSPKTGNRE